MSDSLGEKLRQMEQRFEEIDRRVIDPEVISQGPLYASLLKERGSLDKVVTRYRAWRDARDQLDEAKSILSDADSDPELKAMITTGVRPDGSRMLPPMGYHHYAAMTADDLDAVVLYLRQLPPLPNAK